MRRRGKDVVCSLDWENANAAVLGGVRAIAEEQQVCPLRIAIGQQPINLPSTILQWGESNLREERLCVGGDSNNVDVSHRVPGRK